MNGVQPDPERCHVLMGYATRHDHGCNGIQRHGGQERPDSEIPPLTNDLFGTRFTVLRARFLLVVMVMGRPQDFANPTGRSLSASSIHIQFSSHLEYSPTFRPELNLTMDAPTLSTN